MPDPVDPNAPAPEAKLEAKLAEMQKQHEAMQGTIAQQQEMLARATAALNAVVEEKANTPAPGNTAPTPTTPAPGEPPAWFQTWAQQFANNVEQRFGQLGTWQQEREFERVVTQNQTPPEVVKIANELRAQQMKLGRPLNADKIAVLKVSIFGFRSVPHPGADRAAAVR